MGDTERSTRAAVRLSLAVAGLPVDEDIDVGQGAALRQMIESLSRRAGPAGEARTPRSA